MKGHGGTFSFKVKGDRDEAFRLVSNTKLFTLAISLGGVESLIEHPWTMTHSSMPEDARAAAGITQNLVRVSVGLEDVQDLIADFDQAFAQV